MDITLQKRFPVVPIQDHHVSWSVYEIGGVWRLYGSYSAHWHFVTYKSEPTEEDQATGKSIILKRINREIRNGFNELGKV